MPPLPLQSVLASRNPPYPLTLVLPPEMELVPTTTAAAKLNYSHRKKKSLPVFRK